MRKAAIISALYAAATLILTGMCILADRQTKIIEQKKTYLADHNFSTNETTLKFYQQIFSIENDIFELGCYEEMYGHDFNDKIFDFITGKRAEYQRAFSHDNKIITIYSRFQIDILFERSFRCYHNNTINIRAGNNDVLSITLQLLPDGNHTAMSLYKQQMRHLLKGHDGLLSQDLAPAVWRPHATGRQARPGFRRIHTLIERLDSWLQQKAT